jgi:hypothetical protein
MQHIADDVAHPQERARHRGLKLVRHPVSGIRIELARRVDEATRSATPIDESLNDPDSNHRESGNTRSLMPDPGRSAVDGDSRIGGLVKGNGIHRENREMDA